VGISSDKTGMVSRSPCTRSRSLAEPFLAQP
jgi:hypothetical protein